MRTLLVYGIVLPLAVVVGWMLSSPLNLESVAVIGAVIFILLLPLIFAHHYAMLVFTWNATLVAFFLPGQPQMWAVMVAVNIAMAVMYRIFHRRPLFTHVPSLTFTLLALLAVVLITAKVRGGIGMRALGSQTYGAKGYFYIIFAVLGYFAFAAQSIPWEKIQRYPKLFFLSGLTGLVSNLIYYVKPLWFLYAIFPAGIAVSQAYAEYSGAEMGRWGGLSITGLAGVQYVLARYGLRGTFSFKHPMRALAFFALLTMSAASGFRSTIVYTAGLIAVLFFVEGLWRTRWLFIVGVTVLLGLAAVIPVAQKLPLTIQRTLSVLPIEVDPVAARDAKASLEWRFLMWQAVLPELPKYVWFGKGYNINPTDLFLTQEAQKRGLAPAYSSAIASGDYHNGPLSIYIPFGGPGILAFLAFIAAGTLALWRNVRYGAENVATWNRFLFALFVVKFVFFVGVFGAIASDLSMFTGALGMSVALNRGVARRQVVVPRKSAEPADPYGLRPASA
jgi:hypothetical protein